MSVYFGIRRHRPTYYMPTALKTLFCHAGYVIWAQRTHRVVVCCIAERLMLFIDDFKRTFRPNLRVLEALTTTCGECNRHPCSRCPLLPQSPKETHLRKLFTRSRSKPPTLARAPNAHAGNRTLLRALPAAPSLRRF